VKEEAVVKVPKEETTPQIAETVVPETKIPLSDSQSPPIALKAEIPVEKTEPPVNDPSPPKKAEIKEIAVAEKEPQKKPEIVMTCIEIGSYSQQAPAETSAQWFRQKHKDIQVNVERRKIPVVTQTKVYLAPFKDRHEASLTQQRLTQQGIIDHALFVTNDSKNAISLGVYSSEDNAKKRVNQLKEKGYNNVKLELQQKNDTKYWLSVKIPTDRKEVVDAFKKAFKPIPVLKEVTCQLPTS
ncbi:MAG: hypothetical protein BWK79_11995, partial [Beggiatoa sp. IS2]